MFILLLISKCTLTHSLASSSNWLSCKRTKKFKSNLSLKVTEPFEHVWCTHQNDYILISIYEYFNKKYCKHFRNTYKNYSTINIWLLFLNIRDISVFIMYADINLQNWKLFKNKIETYVKHFQKKKTET